MAIATGDVLASLIRRRLKDQKYNQYLGETLQRLTVWEDFEDTAILSALKRLEKLFDYRWRALVSDALYVNEPSLLNNKQAKTSLVATIHEIFGDGVVDWNRIALVYTIVSLLAGEALRIGKISRVFRYVAWTEEYFKKKLIDAWIARKSGWEEICAFSKRRQKEVEKMYRSACVTVPNRTARSVSPKQEISRAPEAKLRSKSLEPCAQSDGYGSVSDALTDVADTMDSRYRSPSKGTTVNPKLRLQKDVSRSKDSGLGGSMQRDTLPSIPPVCSTPKRQTTSIPPVCSTPKRQTTMNQRKQNLPRSLGNAADRSADIQSFIDAVADTQDPTINIEYGNTNLV